MPKVINQTGVSVDSLQAKLTLLESKFSNLNSKYSVVLDSLQSVNQSATKAEIATSFYTTHLAYYTAFTVLFITLIATVFTIVNWASLYRPTKMFVKKEILAIRSEFNSFRNTEMEAIIRDLNSTTSFAYRSIALNFENSVPGISFIFGIKILKLLDSMKISNQKDALWKKEQITVWVDNSLKYLNHKNFNASKKDVPTSENIKILSKLIANEEYLDYRDSFIEILRIYHEKINQNKSENGKSSEK